MWGGGAPSSSVCLKGETHAMPIHLSQKNTPNLCTCKRRHLLFERENIQCLHLKRQWSCSHLAFSVCESRLFPRLGSLGRFLRSRAQKLHISYSYCLASLCCVHQHAEFCKGIGGKCARAAYKACGWQEAAWTCFVSALYPYLKLLLVTWSPHASLSRYSLGMTLISQLKLTSLCTCQCLPEMLPEGLLAITMQHSFCCRDSFIEKNHALQAQQRWFP